MTKKKPSTKTKTRLTINGPLFELQMLELTDLKFKKFKTNGIPDESDDEWQEKMMDSGSESGLESSDITALTLSVDDVPVKNFAKIFNSEFKRTINPIQKNITDKNCVVQYQSGAIGDWSFIFKGVFDKSKLSFAIYPFELPDGSVVNQLLPMYDEKDFEFEDGSGYRNIDVYLVDKKGNIQ